MEDYRTVKLSRRERQIMDIVYQRGRASVADVLKDLLTRQVTPQFGHSCEFLRRRVISSTKKKDDVTSTVRRNPANRLDVLHSNKFFRHFLINPLRKRS